jgi:hypothetical protein
MNNLQDKIKLREKKIKNNNNAFGIWKEKAKKKNLNKIKMVFPN